jgi:putative transposase
MRRLLASKPDRFEEDSMVALIFNEVLRLDGDDCSGFYRVVATPLGGMTVWLAYIGPWADSMSEAERAHGAETIGSLTQVARTTLEAMETGERLSVIELRPTGKLLQPSEDLKEHERLNWERRQQQMAPFLNHNLVVDALTKTSGIGPLVRLALEAGDGTRATIYRLWKLLCEHGFDARSLHPRFERCGAPGVLRPYRTGQMKVGPKCLAEQHGEQVPHPQRATTEEDRIKILQHARILARVGLPFGEMYDQIIRRVYITQYEQTETGRHGILPTQGTFPNKRQVRHIFESGMKRLERRLRATTQGHYLRNLRGLRGRAYDNVAGPGHAYAIDATVGDIHLRSSINRAWPIGRPIVYMVVDIWSTGIVGFYVCLRGPSWEFAKAALFSTCCDPRLLADLWGFEYINVLTPAPTVPFQVWTDRGEYVSAGARQTCLSLGINLAIDPPYRPDMKGMVEVLHRIAKDEQYKFEPGTIDARRKELGNRPSAKNSALTLREYVHYLHGIFGHYNMFAERERRLTVEMIGAGVHPSPAGLWRFGHEVGIGYRKAITQDRLITGLLKQGNAVARRDGIFHESLQYESEIAARQEWTAHARNFGVVDHSVFHFPGSTSRIWWPDPQGTLNEFSLRASARAGPNISFDELRDFLMFEQKKRDSRAYKRLGAAIRNSEANEVLRKQAIDRTAAAEALYEGPKLHSREARLLETQSKFNDVPAVGETPDFRLPSNDPPQTTYDAEMDKIFDSMNRKAAQ